MSSLIRSRIAPTPSGYLHIGNAYNFLLTETIVRKAAGVLRLRIDDLDTPRMRPEYVQDIFESLTWLGIHTDEGPQNEEQQYEQYSQRLRLAQYEALLNTLAATGLVFACNCSRKDLQQAGTYGQYPGACIDKHIPLDTPGVSWRIQTKPDAVIRFRDVLSGPQQIRLWEVQRHFIIRRRDGLPAYQVASLCDDTAYGINTIIRGEDLLSSTAAQLFLAGLCGAESFLNVSFYHHPLLTDDCGEKLSKSAGSTSLKAMHDKKMSAAALRSSFNNWAESLLQRSHWR
jgi:glutamyl-tRNA synthetase